MPDIIFDLVEPQLLIDFVRAYDNEILREDAQLSLDEYLPDRLTDDLEFRVRRGALNDVDAAEYRAWDTQPKMTGRPGVTRISGSLGPVSRQIPLGEEEQLRLRTLLQGNNDPIVNQIYEDAERMTRAVQVRVELARGDLINDGKVTINENGLQLEADFGRAAAMSVTAAILWSSTATATPLADLLSWINTYVDTNGVEPGEILMSRTRLGNLALNAEMRSYAAANGTTPTRINNQTIANIFANEGLPPWRLYDTQIRQNGARVRVLPVNKIFLMPPAGEPLGNTFYGLTAEQLFLTERGVIERTTPPGIVAVVLQNQNPVQTFTLATAIALPAMPNPNLVMDAVVA